MATDPVRWGILGTANIARASFLPGLRASGDGIASVVAGRELGRTERFARDNGIERAVEGYATLLDDDLVQAVYIPLPNSLHAEWTIAALRAGKAVLCEKPLCLSTEETARVLDVARETGNPLWEAFVFPFRPQTHEVERIVREGEIGDLREVQASFHFLMRNRKNIRLSPDLGGGSLYDVGCYCIRLARLLFAGEPEAGLGLAHWGSEGVDDEMDGVLTFPHQERLLFSCGMFLPPDTFTRVLAQKGELRLSNPYHPGADDVLEVRTEDGSIFHRSDDREPSFTAAIRHINAVVRGEQEPRHLAVEEAMGNARAIDLLYRSARTGRVESLSDVNS